MKQIATGIALWIVSTGAGAQDWPQWRGPNFNGSTTAANLPASWGDTENVLWKTPLPGWSAATPIVWGDRVFVASPDADKNLLLVCLNRKDGSVRWQRTLGTGDRVKGNNNMASPSPVTDGQSVYALFGTGDLAALDFDGNILWQRNLGKDYGRFAIMWIYGSSPLLYKGRLYVQVLQRDEPADYAHAQDGNPKRESYVLCIDPATGKDLWRVLRPTDARLETLESYSTPIPLERKGRTEILILGGDVLTGHNPETGKELWRGGGWNAARGEWMRIVPSPVAVGDALLVCGPKRTPLMAFRAGGSGALSDADVVWQTRTITPDVCTPLVYNGKLFVLDGDRKVLARLDPKTGEKIWQGSLGAAKEVLRASPTGADGKIYVISEDGIAFVVDAEADEFKLLSTISMGEGPCRSSIAAAHGQLFIRTAKHLWCIGKK